LRIRSLIVLRTFHDYFERPDIFRTCCNVVVDDGDFDVVLGIEAERGWEEESGIKWLCKVLDSF
jgi:hypothetical protein